MPEPKRGRPPLTEGDTPAHVNLTVPSRDYDRAHEIAKREGMSVPEVFRRSLARFVADYNSDDE